MHRFATRLAAPAALGIVLGYGALLAMFALTGRWMADGGGHPLVIDFLPFYAAGKLALHGAAASAYDWPLIHAAEARLVGHDFAGFLGWPYPPLFFLVTMALAALPYAAAFLVWITATVLAFALTLARIARTRQAALMGLSLPPALACAVAGQNGFLTAALFGAFLLVLPRKPLLAGLLIALLAYKPQFGILIPVALLAGGQWRAFFAAGFAVCAWLLASWLIAPAALAAFFHDLPQTGATFLSAGYSGWFKLQSVYTTARFVGLSDMAGWSLQAVMTLAMAALTAFAWSRRTVPHEIKAAILVAATLLATPYVYYYDLPLLAVPLAFAWRGRAFDGIETGVVALALLCLGAFVFMQAPMGLAADLLVLALSVRRMNQAPG